MRENASNSESRILDRQDRKINEESRIARELFLVEFSRRNLGSNQETSVPRSRWCVQALSEYIRRSGIETFWTPKGSSRLLRL